MSETCYEGGLRSPRRENAEKASRAVAEKASRAVAENRLTGPPVSCRLLIYDDFLLPSQCPLWRNGMTLGFKF